MQTGGVLHATHRPLRELKECCQQGLGTLTFWGRNWGSHTTSAKVASFAECKITAQVPENKQRLHPIKYNGLLLCTPDVLRLKLAEQELPCE